MLLDGAASRTLTTCAWPELCRALSAMESQQCGTLSQGRHAVARACGHGFTCATGRCTEARATTSFRINGYGVPFQTTENSVEFHEAFCRRVKTSFIFGLIFIFEALTIFNIKFVSLNLLETPQIKVQDSLLTFDFCFDFST